MTTESTQKKKYQSLSHGMGITGLIVGIIALLVSFIPCFGIFALIIGIIAIIISAIGLGVALKHHHPKGLIIGALLTSFIGCGIAYSQYSAMMSIGEDAIEALDEIQKEIKQEQA